PWALPGLGHLMGTSATLMERPAPYNLAVELARGKVNQVRCQAHDWRAGGLQIDPALEREIHEASSAFGRAVTETRPDEAGRLAQSALTRAYQAAQLLVEAYVDQVFHIRYQRQPRLDTALAFRLGPGVPGPDLGPAVARSFNTAAVPLSWNTVEAEEAS